MQQSWRADHDKLTFIACLPVDGQTGEIVSGIQDSPSRMIGDVNLFLSAADEDPEGCIGELELMIARPSLRRRGHGRATVLAFLHYIAAHLQGILDEYKKSQAVGSMSLLLLRVKIGNKNEKSIKLFESVGFIQAADGPNYFDEIELALEGPFDETRTTGLLERYGIHGYIETPYVEPGK
jgi:RimJ/RimL family protein N-acetyltransferase